MIIQEQDLAYQESLRADQEKEEKAREEERQRQEEERRTLEEERRIREEAERKANHRKNELERKRARLPSEPREGNCNYMRSVCVIHNRVTCQASVPVVSWFVFPMVRA